MRKQCLDYHHKEMEALREAFKEYLIELFFLQHLQGNMMDFLAFKKKHYAPLQAYLRQNDLDIEEEEEEDEEEEEKSEVINDEQQALAGSLAGPGSAAETDPFKRQQGLPPTGGMPPAPQATQLTGQKQSQQQYDPSTGPPVQNAASLHTPPPQLPARLPPAGVPTAALPSTLQYPQQPQVVEAQTQLQVPLKTQQPNVPVPAPLPSQLPLPPPQPMQPALHIPVPGKAQIQAAQLPSQPQTVASTRPPMDSEIGRAHV